MLEDDTTAVQIPEISDKPTADEVVRALRAIRERTRQDSDRDDQLRTDLEKVTTAVRKVTEDALEAERDWRGGAGAEAELRHYVDEKGGVTFAPSERPEADYLAEERSLLVDEPTSRWQADFQRWWGRRAVVRGHIVAAKLNAGEIAAHQAASAKVTPKLDATLRKLVARCPEPTLRRALTKIFDDSDDTGGDWIPTQSLVPGVIEPMIGFGGSVANLLAQETATNGRVDLPASLNVPVPYRYGVPTSNTPGQFKPSTAATAIRSASLLGMATRQVASVDAMEDSLVNVAPVLLRKALLSLIYGVDDVCINGDTAATHQDTGLASWNPASAYAASPGGGSDDPRTMWLGWRAEAKDNSTDLDTSGSWTWDNFIALLELMSGAHAIGGGTVAISSIKAGLESMKWDEFQGLDKVGTSSVLTAAGLPQALGVARGGVPFMISPFMTDDLNASGIYDGTTTTKGGVLAVSRAAYGMWSDRRGVISGASEDITRGIRHVVTRNRKIMLKLYASTDKTCAFAYNI